MLTVVFECNALMQKCNFEKKNKIAEKDNDDDESSAVNNPMHETENNLFFNSLSKCIDNCCHFSPIHVVCFLCLVSVLFATLIGGHEEFRFQRRTLLAAAHSDSLTKKKTHSVRNEWEINN